MMLDILLDVIESEGLSGEDDDPAGLFLLISASIAQVKGKILPQFRLLGVNFHSLLVTATTLHLLGLLFGTNSNFSR